MLAWATTQLLECTPPPATARTVPTMPKRKIDAVDSPSTRDLRRTRSSARLDANETTLTPRPRTQQVAVEAPTPSTRTTTRAKSPASSDTIPRRKPVVTRTYGRTPILRVAETADVESSSSSKENHSGTRRTRSSRATKEDIESSDDDEARNSRREEPKTPTRRMTTARSLAKSASELVVAAPNPTPSPRKRAQSAKQRKPEPELEPESNPECVAQEVTGTPKRKGRLPRQAATQAQVDSEPSRVPTSTQTSTRQTRSSKANIESSPVKPAVARKRQAKEVVEVVIPLRSRRPSTPNSLFDVEHDSDGNAPPASPAKRRKKVEPLPKTPSRRKRAAPPVEQSQSDVEEEDNLAMELTQETDEEDSFILSPIKKGIPSAPPSPTKGKTAALPPHLLPCLNAQKRAVLKALQHPPVIRCDNEPELDNAAAYQQLSDLLKGTMERNEGNSCLLLGPKGSGKTRLVERCIAELEGKGIVIRLSGWVQGSDRLALRQIAVQLAEQTGNKYLSELNEDETLKKTEDDAENPFLDDSTGLDNGLPTSLPSASYLPALISHLPTLARPTVVVIDCFDLFALHPRQALLYCLLDTVQSCQSGKGNRGLAVIGLTSRVDTLQLLEKRVKSRFSGRILRVTSARKDYQWINIVKSIYTADLGENEELEQEGLKEWKSMWQANVEKFISEQSVIQAVNDSTSIVGDMRVLAKVFTPPIIHLSESAPFLSTKQLIIAANTQRARPPHPFLSDLSYPALCLLIASHRSEVSGHPIFNFEMLYESFKRQLKLSTAAPIQLHGTSIGMVRCSREVLMGAFEVLSSARIFVCAAAPSGSTAKEFVKYRCVIEREDLKKAVEKTGQINLKKWWNKAN